MKKVCFLIAVMLSGAGAYAQTNAGNMMAGGTLSYQSTAYQSGNANESATFTFSPSFGYFISDNFAAGLSVSVGTSRSGTGSGKSVENSFGIGPFARYYLFTSNPQFGFFGQATISFGSGKNDPAVGGVTRSNYFGFALSPGAVYFFNEHWGMELSITALSLHASDPNRDADNDKVTRFNFGLTSLSPSLGVRYHF